MNSISYIAQKHCQNALKKISAVLLVFMSVIAFGGIGGYIGFVCALFFVLMAVVTFLYTRGSVIDCTLMQIPPAIISFMTFFSGIGVSALGFAVIHYPGMYDYINGLFLQNGYMLTLPPQTVGTLLCVSSLGLFMTSFFTFCAVKYLNTIKGCLKNVISCHGASIFSVASIIMFIIAMALAFVFIFLCGGFDQVMSDSVALSTLAEIVILAVLLLIAGVSAISFINATNSFEMSDDETIKVETNADGTVYVPIKVYSDRDNKPSPIPIPIPNTSEQNGKNAHGFKKNFIISADSLEDSDAIDGSYSEYDII